MIKRLLVIPVMVVIFYLAAWQVLAQEPAGMCETGVEFFQQVGNLPSGRHRFATAQNSEYVYILGGTSYSPLTTFSQTLVARTDGLAGGWQSTMSISPALNGAAAVATDRHIYLIGGYSQGYDSTTVQYAPILSGGLLGDWQDTSSTNYDVSNGGAVILNDYVYVIGNSHYTSTERALINPDGTLGPWQVEQTLNQIRRLPAIVTKDNRIYVIGGQLTTSSSDPTPSVEYTEVLSDGSLAPWRFTSSLIESRVAHQAVVIGAYLYAMGGSTFRGIGSEFPTFRTVERALINPDGTLGPWQFVNAMITNRLYFGAAAVGEEIYAFGGFADPLSQVSLASIEKWDNRYIAPIDYGITINDGALFTNQVTVTLTVGQPPYWDKLVQVSNDGGFAGASWRQYNPCQPWTITRYGSYIIPRTVYVRFKNPQTGQLSATFSDDIILDETPPGGTVEVEEGTLGLAAIAAPITLQVDHTIYLPLVVKAGPAANVTLRLAAVDDVSGVAEMRVWSEPDTGYWQPYKTTIAWFLPAGGQVYVQFRDWAGNVSGVIAAGH